MSERSRGLAKQLAGAVASKRAFFSLPPVFENMMRVDTGMWTLTIIIFIRFHCVSQQLHCYQCFLARDLAERK